MTMTLPSAINLHTADHDADSLARGVNGTPAMGVKGNGNFPLTAGAAQLNNNTLSSPTGVPDIGHWQFSATPTRNVSVDTLLLVVTLQYNAPNRVQCSDVANDGMLMRIGSGSGSPRTRQTAFHGAPGWSARPDACRSRHAESKPLLA